MEHRYGQSSVENQTIDNRMGKLLSHWKLQRTMQENRCKYSISPKNVYMETMEEDKEKIQLSNEIGG